MEDNNSQEVMDSIYESNKLLYRKDFIETAV